MAEPFVTYEQNERVVTVTINRPDSRNAVAEHSDCDDLVEAIERADADRSVSVLILTGAGSAFSAGGNLKSMRDRVGIGRVANAYATRSNYKKGVQRIPLALQAAEITTIAAVNGHAIGLGLDLALFCDLRVAADTAKFASSFVKVGIVPGDGGAWILPRIVGYARAAELILSGDTIDASAALAMGLVNQVVPAAEVLPAARALAARVTINPPHALRLAKRLLRQSQSSSFADLQEISAAFQAISHETADHEEALAAFFEKRTPNFKGQ